MSFLVPPAAPLVPELTAEQVTAAQPRPGVTVVSGAPGTGKSTVAAAAACARVLQGSQLERIVILAHSRSAAQSLRRDLVRRLGGSHLWPQVTTSHGLALGLLRRFLPHDEGPWRLLRAPEQEQRIRELLRGVAETSWPTAVRGAVRTREFARQLREVLARARQLALDPPTLSRLAAQAGDELFGAVADFMETYLTVGDFSATLDYAELVYRARLLLTDGAVASAVGATFDAIIVDDVQESDHAQLGLLTDLAAQGIALLAIGDPQQRIGGYRGASAKVLPELAQLPGATSVNLTQGFRLRAQVSEAVSHLAVRLPAHAAAQLPVPAGPGGSVQVRIFDDEAAELSAVAQELRAAIARDGLRWRDVVVIARAGRSQVSRIAKELIRLGIPVDVAGDDIALAQQPAVAVLLLALGVAAQGGTPRGDEARLLLSSPLCGIDGIGQRQLGRALLARHRCLGTSEVLLSKALGEPELLAGIEHPHAEAVYRLAQLLSSVAAALHNQAEVQEALWLLWEATGWPQQLRQQALHGNRRAHADLDAVVELFELAARLPDLRGIAGAQIFQREISDQEIPADTGRELNLAGQGVRVATAHRTRGLEWEAAWVVGVQEGLWPRLTKPSMLLDPDRLGTTQLNPPSLEGRLAAERQLFYLACSRAKSRLSVSASEGIEGEGKRASRFLGELGVVPERVSGSPAQLLTASSLVGTLRRRLLDPEASPGLRRAAATRLAGLSSMPDAFTGADPQQWWALAGPSSGPPRRDSAIVITGSALEALLTCPRRWFLARRAAGETGRNSRASVGDVVHLIAQQAASENLTAEEMHARLAAVWDRIPFETEWLSATERAEINAAIDRFARYHAQGELLAVEERFSVSIHLAGQQIVLRGTVDRLERDADGRLRVVDLKTGRRPLTEAAVAQHPQLGVYQLATRLGAFEHVAPGERRVAPPALAYLRSGEELPLLISQPSIDDQPALRGQEVNIGPTWVHDKLHQAAAIINSGQFDATQCDACRYCPFSSSCPAISPLLGGRP